MPCDRGGIARNTVLRVVAATALDRLRAGLLVFAQRLATLAVYKTASLRKTTSPVGMCTTRISRPAGTVTLFAAMTTASAPSLRKYSEQPGTGSSRHDMGCELSMRYSGVFKATSVCQYLYSGFAFGFIIRLPYGHVNSMTYRPITIRESD